MRRVYGRITSLNAQGKTVKTWVTVVTDANGNDDGVFITALCQYFKLNLNESPRFAWAGIPARDAVAQQVPPDYYVALGQQIFAPYFASLIISRQPQSIKPIYNVSILTHSGVQLPAISIPT